MQMKHARNGRAWAIGKPVHGGFRVRRVVWGRLLAREERRAGEQIRAARIWVEEDFNPRRGSFPDLPDHESEDEADGAAGEGADDDAAPQQTTGAIGGEKLG